MSEWTIINYQGDNTTPTPFITYFELFLAMACSGVWIEYNIVKLFTFMFRIKREIGKEISSKYAFYYDKIRFQGVAMYLFTPIFNLLA